MKIDSRASVFARAIACSVVLSGLSRTRSALAATVAFLILTQNALAQVTGELRGRIVDAATSQGISNALVQLSGRTEIVRSGADGVYAIRGLEAKTYSVSARAVGYTARSVDVDVKSARTTSRDFQLTAAAQQLSNVLIVVSRDTTTRNATVFDRATIEKLGRRDLGELLQSVPGVVVTQNGGAGQLSGISIRGSSANQVLILVDGVPLNSAISGAADLSQISTESIQNVTVRRGSQSARYGPRAMAGVIVIETRQPAHEMSALLRSGAFGEHAGSLTVAGDRAIGNHYLGGSLIGDYRTVDGNFQYTLPPLRGGGQSSRINSDATSTQLTGNIRLDEQLGTATVRGTWQHTDRGLAGTIIQPSSTGRQTQSRLSGGASTLGVAHTVAWTVAADITHEGATFNDATPPFGTAFHDTISATGITASASASLDRENKSAAIGAELRTLDITSTMLAGNALHYQRLVGGWANTRYAHQLAASGIYFNGELSARLDDNSLDRNSAFSPRAVTGLSWKRIATTVSLGSGYSPPTLADQFFHEGVQAKANPDLKAERTLHDLEGRLTLNDLRLRSFIVGGEATAYRSDISGMILWFPDFRFVWSPNNYDVHRSGWELTGKTGLPAAHLEVQGIVNRSDVTYAGGILTGQVVYRPRDSGNINASFTPHRLRMEVSNRYVGVRRTVASSSLNTLEPYWMTDVKLSSSFAERSWTFSPAVGIENAFNHEAAMLVDYPFPTRTWSVSLRVRRTSSQSP
ncbi:MAG: TonB-dependent receptor plug domain-containing protein [Gemmatimonadaceae bacterium]